MLCVIDYVPYSKFINTLFRYTRCFPLTANTLDNINTAETTHVPPLLTTKVSYTLMGILVFYLSICFGGPEKGLLLGVVVQ